MTLPNELRAQLDGRDWNDMSSAEQRVEIKWCIERCEMNLYEYPERRRYYTSQIRELKKML